MEIKKIENGNVAVTVSQAQWAQLYKIIDWVRVEGGSMDDASVALNKDEIPKVLEEWDNITSTAITQ